MAVIKVPKTPASAFNPTRPVSTLLRTQIAALQIAVANVIDSEGEAAEYIKELTAQLQKYHPHTVPRGHSEKRAAKKAKTGTLKKTTRIVRGRTRP